MSDTVPPPEGEASAPPAAIDQGAYELLRERLAVQARALAGKAQALNEARVRLFGGGELTLLASERIRTEHNCVPRDIHQVGGHLLFGYNVSFGLRTQTGVDDVFSLHRCAVEDGHYAFEKVEAPFLREPRFVADFEELYRYYKAARLLQLRRVDGKLLAVFQTGATARDVKVFRWSESPDGQVAYLDNRGERDHVFPPSHDFEWTTARRAQHVAGRHPHVDILGEAFVDTVAGDLTIKIENSTEDGQGIYREPVQERDQTLDDAEFHYARVGPLILLKVLPYREKDYRYFVFNTRTRTATRIDAIGIACVQLPEDHGLVFPGGYYLATGHTKSYDAEVAGLEFLQFVRSPNGEDALFVFHQRDSGRFLLLPYNLIRREITAAIQCHGFTLFEDGRMVLFRSTSDEPTRVHPMQVWQTPFASEEHAARRPSGGSFLEKVGNADLVRGISDALSLRRMAELQEPTRRVYEDLIAATTRAQDAYYWLDHPEACGLLPAFKELRATAESVVDEFEKVEAIRAQSRQAVAAAEAQQRAILGALTPADWTSVDTLVDVLGRLTRQRGALITLRDLRYVDLLRLDGLEAELSERTDEVRARAAEFLTGDEALRPYHERLRALEARVPGVATVAAAEPLREEVRGTDEGLQTLTDMVSSLDVQDATVRTRILEGISEVLGGLNRVRALVEGRRKELLAREAVGEFAAQFKVLGQSVTSALGLADTPEKCDAELARLLLSVEEMEGRFSEFEEFVQQLGIKREEVYEAFSSRKQGLLDARQRRAEHLLQSADRILDGVRRRVEGLSDPDALNAYFASDPMVTRLRDVVERLRELGDGVKAGELESRLKAARQEAGRSLRDRQDMFEDGGEVLRLGRHRFSVSTQPLDLTLVPREGGMFLHLSGTDFYERVTDAAFAETQAFWDQTFVSETAEVYRSEFLAYQMLAEAEAERGGLSLGTLHAAVADGGLPSRVRAFAAPRYDEGYERGVHDADAARILEKVLGLHAGADLLRFAATPRALAVLFWSRLEDPDTRGRWERQARSLGHLRAAMGLSPAVDALAAELASAMSVFGGQQGWTLGGGEADQAGRYLFEELAQPILSFATSADAVALRDAFLAHLHEAGRRHEFEDDLEQLRAHLGEQRRLAEAWLATYLARAAPAGTAALAHAAPEVVAALLTTGAVPRTVSHAATGARVEGLLGHHPRIASGALDLRLDEFLDRLARFTRERVPGYRAFQEARHRLLERERVRLRLEEYKPRVMSAFVRNRLLDEVYLPLIGDNLAKQIGTAGAARRTDQMGLLLLVSPPGYGKTTLMEYVAHRLGLVFLKVNGPALGHAVTSLDPAEAPNATARQEVEKLNLALEMGNNVLLYLDDIQHTNPELLQKFISLCDAQRRMEGVWNGRTRTYDLRGKRFAVAMAGNPYTESGQRFRIPDMLTSRADVYNLGEILQGRDALFALSYLENALTSNAVLAPLSTREPADVHRLVEMARGEAVAPDQIAHPYSAAELAEIRAVLQRLVRLQALLLRVNQEYIASAAQEDAFRTEPRFQLQGSYRNMNKLAEKVVAAMNDAELEALVDDHYAGEAQTLTTGAEHNLLKLGELRGRMGEEQRRRWDEIKRAFARVQAAGGAEDDPVTRLTGSLGLLAGRLEDIAARIAEAARHAPAPVAAVPVTVSAPALADPGLADRLSEQLGGLAAGLAAIASSIVEAASSGNGRARVAPPAAMAATAAAPPPDLGPYLDRLNEAVAALGTGQAASVVQFLPPGVVDILDEMTGTAEKGLLETLRSITRWLKQSQLTPDPRLTVLMNRTTKHLDHLKDLAAALRRIDTTALRRPAPGRPPGGPA